MRTPSQIVACLRRHATPALLGFALCVSLPAHADTTTLTLANTSRNGSTTGPVTMQFPLTRGGDLGYSTVLNYRTIDGTAQAGIDYTAAVGSISLAAGQGSTTIPITIAAQSGGATGRSFQLEIDNAASFGPAPSFSAVAQTPFPSGSLPNYVTTADINGDGKPDLIVTNYNTAMVSVLLNITVPGDTVPTFAAAQNFATGMVPTSVASADINGDGKLDLIVANSAVNTVSVLLNTTAAGAATPSFAAQQTFAAGTGPNSIAIADINGDGKPDVIVANSGSDNTLSVLLNATPTGAAAATFATQQTFPTGSSSLSVAVADINGDGKPDLIAASYDESTVSVLINTTAAGATTAGFSARQTFATGTHPLFATAADINGDGKPDLIVATSDNTVSVLLNSTVPGSSSPGFATAQDFGAGTLPVAVAAADLNGDGKPDLVMADIIGGGGISVLFNTTPPGAATPSFSDTQTVNTNGNANSITIADINGDGKPDLIVVDGSNVSVVLNSTATGASAGFTPQRTFATGTSAGAVASADINGDGKPDLIVVGSTSGVSVLLDTTLPGAAVPAFATRQSFATGANPMSVSAADLDGDGRPDLVVANYNDNTVSVLLNTTAAGASTPTFAAQQTFATGPSPYAVTTADINGDGRPDLIVVNSGDVIVGGLDTYSVSVLLNTTAPGATTPSFAPQQSFATGNVPYFVRAVDINGDGRPDLIVADSADGNVSVLLNTTAAGATTPSFAAQQVFAAGSGVYSVTSADINGDGRPDLIVPNSGGLSVLLNTTAAGASTPSFATQQPFSAGANGIFATTADVDGDGKIDLIMVNNNGNTVSLLLNTTPAGATTPSFATRHTFTTGSGTKCVVATDLNGDGKPDLVISNTVDNTLSVLLNTQYLAKLIGNPATGTIVNDDIFGYGFE